MLKNIPIPNPRLKFDPKLDLKVQKIQKPKKTKNNKNK